jgi:hypothetical protein
MLEIKCSVIKILVLEHECTDFVGKLAPKGMVDNIICQSQAKVSCAKAISSRSCLKFLALSHERSKRKNKLIQGKFIEIANIVMNETATVFK